MTYSTALCLYRLRNDIFLRIARMQVFFAAMVNETRGPTDCKCLLYKTCSFSIFIQVNRSSRPKVFHTQNFAKFTRKHMFVEFLLFIKNTSLQVFSNKFAKFLRTAFFLQNSFERLLESVFRKLLSLIKIEN